MLLAESSLIIIIDDSSLHLGHIAQKEFNKSNGIAIKNFLHCYFYYLSEQDFSASGFLKNYDGIYA